VILSLPPVIMRTTSCDTVSPPVIMRTTCCDTVSPQWLCEPLAVILRQPQWFCEPRTVILRQPPVIMRTTCFDTVSFPVIMQTTSCDTVSNPREYVNHLMWYWANASDYSNFSKRCCCFYLILLNIDYMANYKYLLKQCSHTLFFNNV